MTSPRDALFRRIDPGGAVVRLRFQGAAIAARAGDTVAAALLAAGVGAFRETPVGGAPRLPWCMMGVCFDCLVEINGTANRQACMVTVAEGMDIRGQRGAPALFDLESE